MLKKGFSLIVQRLRRSLTQREGETSSFKDLLTKAEQGLKHSEEAVQVRKMQQPCARSGVQIQPWLTCCFC